MFDILGFKSLIRQADHPVPREALKSKIEDLLQILESDSAKQGRLDFVMFSDTFVVFAPDLASGSYPWFLLVCRSLITKSIYIELPLRGAISLGPAFFSKEPTIVLGSSFVEAYEYCEDQDWIGLLLTPSAVAALRRAGLEPLRHDFVSDVVPLRKKSSEGVLAYRFQNGSANFDSPLLAHLGQMRHHAPESAKQKYQDTIAFIRRHYRYVYS
ncbi:MAG: hypothetical protein AB1451_10125 [Nitrospirota bacterium]